MVAMAAVLATGCATLFSDSHRRVSMKSEPEGATVTVNGMYMGETPVDFVLDNHKEYVVEFNMDGHKRATCVLNTNANKTFIVLDVLLGLLPVVVDLATGAYAELARTNCAVSLPAAGGDWVFPDGQ